MNREIAWDCCSKRRWCYEKKHSCKLTGRKDLPEIRKGKNKTKWNSRLMWLSKLKKKKKKRHQKSLKPHQGAKTSAKWGVDKGSKLINKQKGALPCKVWMTKRENQELESVSYHFHHKSWWWGGGFNTATSLTFSLFLPPFFFSSLL